MMDPRLATGHVMVAKMGLVTADANCWAPTPLVKRSAGLSVDGQYFQLVEISCISPPYD